ncbi:J domain-containing protein [Burkholderia anthina]|uniref:J domain-containing protein n=1 Tax=Burkholderia anthina TaxID=179879 RepID=UPI00158B5496|nr:J domain-containing protein [Burkholderia anthina]
MKTTTHYDVLRATRDAPPEVIRAAYRALSQKWHPDKNKSPDAGRMMQAINAAYEILSDSARRAHYDQELDAEDVARAASQRQQQTTYTRAPRPAQEKPAPKSNTEPPQAERRRSFEVDWGAVAHAQRDQKRKYRMLGRDSLLAGVKAFALIVVFFLIFGHITF